MNSLSILGGRTIDPASGLDQINDIHIADGAILHIGITPEGFAPEQQIQANGKIVCPGFVDLCARMREPGEEYKATIRSEARAAVRNGITTLCCPPDTDPIIDTTAVAELLQQRAREAGMSKVLPIAALTQQLEGQHLSEMNSLKIVGCIGMSNALKPIENTEVMRHAMAYAATCEMPVFLHPRESWLGRKNCLHEGIVSARLGLPGIPETAETIAVARDLLLIELTGVRAHFCRLSTARAVNMVKTAQAQGLPVTADVSAHQLFLTEQDVQDYDTACYVYPPLRTPRDRDALRDGLSQGIVGAICSDHQPHEPDAKDLPFIESASGISALDTLLPLALKFGDEMDISMPKVLAFITNKPAGILGLDTGRLEAGRPADICIFDPEQNRELSPATMHSVQHNSPFLGLTVKGLVTHTLVDGKL
ncbi:MAG: dihydroorotase, partial [Pseudomonadota bacterium]